MIGLAAALDPVAAPAQQDYIKNFCEVAGVVIGSEEFLNEERALVLCSAFQEFIGFNERLVPVEAGEDDRAAVQVGDGTQKFCCRRDRAGRTRCDDRTLVLFLCDAFRKREGDGGDRAPNSASAASNRTGGL